MATSRLYYKFYILPTKVVSSTFFRKNTVSLILGINLHRIVVMYTIMFQLNITDGSSTLTKQPSQVDNCILASTEISDDHPPEEVESKEAEESSTDNENMSHRLATAVSTPLDVRDNNLMIWDQTNSNGSMSVSSSAINTAELSRATGGAISSREESSRNGEDSAQPRSSIDEGEAGNGKSCLPGCC